MKKIKAFTLIETLIVIAVFCIGILTVLYWLSQTLRNKEYANTQIQAAFFAREWIEMMFNIRDANYHKELPWNCIFEWENSLDVEKWCKNFLKNNQVLKVDIGDDHNYLNIIDISDISNIWDLEKEEDFDKIFEKYQIYKHVDEGILYDKSDFNKDWTIDLQDQLRFFDKCRQAILGSVVLTSTEKKQCDYNGDWLIDTQDDIGITDDLYNKILGGWWTLSKERTLKDSDSWYTFLFNHVEEWGEETWFARYIVIKSVGWVNSDDNLLKIESHVLYKKWIFKWEKVMETFIWNYEFNQ